MLAQAKTGMMKKKIGLGETLKKDWRKNKVAYLIVLPVLIYYILFHYKPIYGAIIAFENFRPAWNTLSIFLRADPFGLF